MLALQNGDDIKTIQENVDHYNESFTLSIYAYSTKKMKQASADRMDALISKIAD